MSATNAKERLLGWLVNGAPALFGAVFLAFYIQKSDGNGWLETMLCIGMGALGMFLVRTSMMLAFRHPWKKELIKWRQLAKVTLSFMIGSLLLASSLSIIDKEDTDYSQSAAIGEERVDADGFKLTVLDVNHGEQNTRISVNVVNETKAPLVLNYIRFYVTKKNGPTCWTRPDVYNYSLDANVQVTDDGIAEAYVMPSEGKNKGRDVAASGRLLTDVCKRIAMLEGSFYDSIPLQPQHIVGLAIDIPNTFTVEDTRTSEEAIEASFQLANKERNPYSFVALVVGFDGDANGACIYKRDSRLPRGAKEDHSMCDSLLKPLKQRVN